MHSWSEDEIRNELYGKVLQMTGPRAVLLKLCEELAELIQELAVFNFALKDLAKLKANPGPNR